MPDTVTIECAKCNVPLQGPTPNPKPQDRFVCPRCGAGDTLENIMRETQDYVTDKVGESIGRVLENAARESKALTFKKNRRPKKCHRFIVDLGL